MTSFAVEKDWWVSRILETVFKMDVAQHLVFKGGTSLSKAWKLIHRFSEDIDLAIDREFFEGYGGDISRTQINKRAVLSLCSKCVLSNNSHQVCYDMYA